MRITHTDMLEQQFRTKNMHIKFVKTCFKSAAAKLVDTTTDSGKESQTETMR